MTTGKRGRPSKRTPEVEDAILLAITKGYTLKVAAAHGGIGYSTMREWALAYPDFAEALEKAEGIAQAKLLDTVVKWSEHGSMTTRPDGTVIEGPGAWQAAAWVLERRWPKDYSRHERVEVQMRSVIESLTEDPNEREAALAEVQRILAKARQ